VPEGTPVHRSVGEKPHGSWYALGEYDGYNVWEAPDNLSTAAVAFAMGYRQPGA
jgi:uncharacterized protein with GYD domain